MSQRSRPAGPAPTTGDPTSSDASHAIGPARRWEAWLWTGPVGHLLGGSLDFLQASARYGLARLRGRPVR